MAGQRTKLQKCTMTVAECFMIKEAKYVMHKELGNTLVK